MESFEDALRQVHHHGYSCHEVQACVARLAFPARA
jgi:hypothetical protein